MRASTLYVNLDRDVTTGLSYLHVKLYNKPVFFNLLAVVKVFGVIIPLGLR